MKTALQKSASCHRGKKSSSFVLKALPSALLLVFANAGWAVDPPPTINVGGAAGLPQNGSVISGSAGGAMSTDGNHLTVTAADRTVLNWGSFSVFGGKILEFVQPSGGAVLNRVALGADASQILGTLKANGTVMLMNPNGIMFGPNSTVNVGSLIATTGTMNDADLEDFVRHGHLRISGAVGGIVNEGNIIATAGTSGLVALVAPSVINQKSIIATGGKITLAGSTAATISLNGGLYAFAIPAGATGVQVSNTASASLNAANIHIGVGDAANLLSGVINLEGVQQADNAIVVNGHTVELKSALQAPNVSGSSRTVNVAGAARIQNGVDIARVGGSVNIAAGTYVQPITLRIDKSLTLSGAGEGATLLDARGVTGYGIQVTADDVTLNDFTLYGPTANIDSAYGIKVAPSGNGASARLHDFSIRDVTIRGSGKAELDLNGVNGAVIDHVTADGAPVGNNAGTTAGAGIQLTDSANVTITNSTTRNNAWGGLALYQANRSYNQQVNNITVAGNNSFTELNPVYMQDESASRDFGALNIAGFDYAVRNSSSTNSNHQYTWLQASRQNAFDHAVNLGSSGLSYVQGWNGALTTQNFHVGTGSLLGGGSQAMSIGTAVTAVNPGGTVDVYAGSYAEQLTLNKAGLTLQGHEGAKLVVPDATEVNGISIAANNVTVAGMEIAGPVNQPYYQYYASPAPSNISRGIAVADGVTGFAIRNNNIHDVRNGILIHGRNSTGSVTDNRIENTKSGISVQYTDGAGINMAGNTQGPVGNEWGINLHLNRGLPITNAPTLAWQQSLLDLSDANAGWSVQDQAYTSSNRTHANVATTGSAGAQGSLLTPLGSIQDGVNAVVVGGKVSVAAGNYTGSVALNKTNVTITGREGANLDVAESQTGFDISANGVTVEGMQITGPYSQNFAAINWTGLSTTGVKVASGVTGATIRNNTIKNVRSGIQVTNAAATITGNTIENTKGAILVRSNNVTMSGNSRGLLGNEWDIVFLDGVANGSYFVSPLVSEVQYGAGVMAMSAANGNMHILDRRYGVNGLLGSTPQFGNRSHVTVSSGADFTAADDFNLGNGLGNDRQPLGFISDGINAVVSGGVVDVKAGTYAESLSITKALTLQGAGAGQSVITPSAGDAVLVSGNIGTSAEVLIDGFTFRNAPDSGVRVKNDTVLRKLTVQNSDFLHNGKFGFFAAGSATAGIPGLQNVSLLNSTFTGNGAPYTSATSLGQGDINFNFYNGNATLKDLRITGENEFVGIQFRGFHDNVASGGVHDAGRLEFDNVTIEGSFRRPSGSAGSWNPEGPGDAIHLLEYGSVANVSFNNVVINPSIGHGMFLEGLGSTLDIGNTRFGAPDSAVSGTGSSPTRSWNIYAGSNDRNNVKTNVNATRASFTGSANGFAIEDRVHHALDVAGLGVVSWDAGNLYVTQASGSIQRGVDAASTGNTVNVAAGVFAEDVALGNRYNLLFNDTRLHSLTLDSGAAGSGIGGAVTAEGTGGFLFNAPVNLLADTTLTTRGADITLNGDVQNAGGVTRALRLIAGSGGTRGNVHMTTGGSAAGPLGQLDISANKFSLASTLWVRSYKIDALGDVTLSNSTLRAQDTGAASTLNAGGDVTGSTISQGSVEVVSAGDIDANIAGTDVVAQAQGTMDVVVTASQTATLTADTIVGNVTAADVVAQSQGDMSVVVTASNSASLTGDSVVANVTAPVVAVEAVNDAQISGAASQITLDAPRGSVSGSFGQVSNTGGGLVNVNGKPQGNSTLSSNSENNRVVPAGGVLDSGAEGGGLQLAQAGGSALQGGSDVVMSAPESAGDAVDSGRAVELDMAPRKRGQDKNSQEKDKEKE